MHTCQHCDKPVAPQAPYCSACGRPRMLESLLAPRARPDWDARLWNIVAAAAVLFFVIGSSVAFLREAKAVRVARAALDLGSPAMNERADGILTEFLAEHPEHDEGLSLAATAAARLGVLGRTAGLRSRLAASNPERLGELDPEIERAIDSSILGLQCNASGILTYYDDAGPLGDTFRPRVLSNVQDAVRRCQAANQEQAAYSLLVGMVERGAGETLIEETYLQPLRRAVAAGRYDEAESLARGAARFSADTREAADEVLLEIRGKVEASATKLDETCRAIREDSRYRISRWFCFPPAPPAHVSGALDGWGRPLHYAALHLDPTLQCHQGFELRSYGADGAETAGVTGRPETDFVCRFVQGRQEWVGPSRFWRPPV